jgi:hypothetical protein
LKACGVVTGAAAKRNPFVSEIRLPPSAFAENSLSLVRRPQAVTAVPPAQFIHQVLEVGREARRRTQALLQMFTDGVANRSARLAINLFTIVGDSAIHDEFRFVCPFLLRVSVLGDVGQVTGRGIVSRHKAIACRSVKIE